MDFTVFAGKTKKRAAYTFHKARVRSFAALVKDLQAAVGVSPDGAFVLYDTDWRPIYDLKSFAKAPERRVYLERMGKATDKLPSIGSNSLGASYATNRTTVSSPGAKAQSLPVLSRSSSEPLLPKPTKDTKKKSKQRRSVKSVDRNNNQLAPSGEGSAPSSRRSSSKPPKPATTLAPPVANVRRISGGSKKRRSRRAAPAASVVDAAEERDSRNEGLVRKSKFVLPLESRAELSRRYKFDSVIGDGNFAVVSRCLDRRDGSAWAVKEIDKANVKGKVYYIENEVDLMLRCDHASICRLREAYQSPDAYYLVLDLITGGDVFDAIKKEGTFSEGEAATITSDVSNALQYLHHHNIVHRDIKLENLLLTKDRRVKLADFGLACKVLGKLYRVCGTPTYVAAEILAEEGYGLEVDVWSLGVILHIMLVGYAPFRSSNRDTLFKLIQEGQFSFQLPGWEAISKGARDLVGRMVEVRVAERISARGVLRSSWLRQMTNPRD